VRRRLTAALLACWLLAAEGRFEKFSRELPSSSASVAVIEAGRVIWQRGRITAPACDEPVIAERIAPKLLDTPAPMPTSATIRQVLESTADGTPGEEVLENHGFLDALHFAGPLSNAVAFAQREHETLGWFAQDYAGQRVLWCQSSAVLIVRIPDKKLAMVATGAAQLEDGNIARSPIALAFFNDVAGLSVPESDELIDHGLVRQALDKFPDLESAPDVSLLHLFAHLGFPETEASASAVIKAHPSLPTAWFYYGQYLENSKRYREAAACFEKITMHQPPWHNWTVAAAQKELKYLKTY
jgi:tetratricopeptide (TPR) repeat protein